MNTALEKNMSVVIVGGHDRMVCRYMDICKEYGCASKVFTQDVGSMDNMIGRPDLIILFTNPTSHTLVRRAKNQASRRGIALVQSHSGSCSALKRILSENIACSA